MHRLSIAGLVIALFVAASVYLDSRLPATRPEATAAATMLAVSESVDVPPFAFVADDGSVPVVKVVDGDTFDVETGSAVERARLIGLDTPETVDPRKPVQCFGREASEEAKRLLTGARVRLESDTTQHARDKYGRMLAYAYLSDGTLFNEHMIVAGYGHEYTYRTPYRFRERFKAAEKAAREGGRGLWAEGACQ